jgi:small subunit ribosomal protein S20
MLAAHREETLAVPKIKSAKKAMRQARVRTERNKAQRSSLKTALKKARASATADAANAAYAFAARLLDRAARKGLIHKNNAARQKSRLAALVKRLKEKAS